MGLRQASRATHRFGLPIAVVVIAMLAGGTSAASVGSAQISSAPNLGAHQQVCSLSAKTCCPGVNCDNNVTLARAAPFLVQTANGTESISSHEIHVGQRFAITFHIGSPSTKVWTFPDIARKLSSCHGGVDQSCTYLARPGDVTYPASATYNGWSDYTFDASDIHGVGIGFGYYAIIGNEIAISGRLANKHGQGIPRGGTPVSPGGIVGDPGVLVSFLVRHDGILIDKYSAAPSIHSSRAHPYDVGYFGVNVKRGTYVVEAGDPIEHIKCDRRMIHVNHAISNLNFVCN